MQKTLAITLTDLRIFLSDRMNLIMATILPIMMTLLLGGAIDMTPPEWVRFDVLDLDGSPQSAGLIDALRAENNALLLCPMDNRDDASCMLPEDGPLTQEAMTTRVTDGVTSALLVIPAGYGEALAALQPASLEYYSIANLTTGDAVLQSVEAVLQEVNGAVVAAQVAAGMADRLTGPGEDGSIFSDAAAREAFAQAAYANAGTLWAEDNVGVRYVLTSDREQAGETNVSTSGYSQSVPGMSTMFVLFTVLGGMGLLLEERKQWTLQRLAIMPISRAQILGGKILARFTTGILQFGVLFVVGLIVGLDFGQDPLALLVVIVAYTLCITALTFTIATFVKTEMQAGGLVTLLSLVLAALGGAWWPLEIVPEFMRLVAHISPVAWAMDGFSALLFYGGGLVDVLLPVAVLLAAAGAFFAFGISRFRFE